MSEAPQYTVLINMIDNETGKTKKTKMIVADMRLIIPFMKKIDELHANLERIATESKSKILRPFICVVVKFRDDGDGYFGRVFDLSGKNTERKVEQFIARAGDNYVESVAFQAWSIFDAKIWARRYAENKWATSPENFNK